MAWHPFRNLGWKALALALGILLWFTVSGDLAIERAIDGMPVTMKNVGAGVQAVLSPAHVTVTVRGSREELGSLADTQLAAWVDLNGLGPGQYRLPVRVDTPMMIDLAKVMPDTVEVRVK
jgi:YbbR domain-containing protein